MKIDDPRLHKLIGGGGVGVLPTDTVYGLVAKAADEAAVKKLYAVKPRENQAGTLIAATIEQLQDLGLSNEQLRIVNKYWPAPLSVAIDATNAAAYLKVKRQSLAVRIPDSASLLSFLDQTGPLMTTSANPPSEPTATTIGQCIDYFGESVDFYVDGGDLQDRMPSTIAGLDETGQLAVYRTGAFNGVVT